MVARALIALQASEVNGRRKDAFEFDFLSWYRRTSNGTMATSFIKRNGMKSMCRRRPTGAALAIVAAVAHQASAFVAPDTSISTLPSLTKTSKLHASVEDATTSTATDGNAASIEEKADATTASMSENPRKSGLALMLDDGELFAYPDGGDGADQLFAVEATAVATSFAGHDGNNNERRRTMVEIPSEIMYHGNLVVHTPLKQKLRNRRRKERGGLLQRLLSRIRAS